MANFQDYDDLNDLRLDPFTGVYTPKGYGYDGGVSPERRTIPSSAPYQLTAFELIRDDTVSTVNIDTVIGATTLTEVAATTSPGNLEYRVNYSGPRAGLIEFNSAQAGLEVDISYYGLGSVVQVATYKESLLDYLSRTGLTLGNGTADSPNLTFENLGYNDAYIDRANGLIRFIQVLVGATVTIDPSNGNIVTVGGINVAGQITLDNGTADSPNLTFANLGYNDATIDRENGLIRFLESVVGVTLTINPATGAIATTGQITLDNGTADSPNLTFANLGYNDATIDRENGLIRFLESVVGATVTIDPATGNIETNGSISSAGQIILNNGTADSPDLVLKNLGYNDAFIDRTNGLIRFIEVSVGIALTLDPSNGNMVTTGNIAAGSVTTNLMYSPDTRMLKSFNNAGAVTANVAGNWVGIAQIPVGRGDKKIHAKVSFTAGTSNYSGSFYVDCLINEGASAFQVNFTPCSSHKDANVAYVGRCRIISSSDTTDRGCELQMEMKASSTVSVPLSISIENMSSEANDYFIPVTPYDNNTGILPDASTTFQASADWWRFGLGETVLWTGNVSIANGATTPGGTVTLPITVENTFQKYTIEYSATSNGQGGDGKGNRFDTVSAPRSDTYSVLEACLFGNALATMDYNVRPSLAISPNSISITNNVGSTVYILRVVGER